MKSKVQIINKTSSGRRIVIPQPVIEMLNIEAGDALIWNPDVKNGEICFYITKEETKK